MPIRAILFDLDDTLIVDEAVSRETIAVVAALAFSTLGADEATFQRSVVKHAHRLAEPAPVRPFCKRIGISPYECLWGEFVGVTDDFQALHDWAHQFRRDVFDAALRDQQLESDDVTEQLATRFEAERRKLIRLMPDAREVLTRLALDYRIGLLTNGAPDLQREKIAASGLVNFFNAIVISGEHNVGKPKPEIFQRLLADLSVTPEEAVMVGNSMERDIAGARNAGVRNVWIKVSGAEEHADVQPDHTITGLAELPDLLAKMSEES
ncbi:MAG: HAD family hydrolase [Chthoniobacterales bacterium]